MMLLLSPFALPRAVVAIGYALSLLAPTTTLQVADNVAAPVLPILEVIKVYGKLAGPTCFGKTAPTGSSCQVSRQQDWQSLFASSSNGLLDKAQFAAQLQQRPFAWPLKPYGIDKGNAKTATMNKGAETRLYMDLLEARGLYDKRNPTGPLPTSLRPALNRLLQQEGVAPLVVDLVFERLATTDGKVSIESEALWQGREAIDYYDFLDFLGKNSITWD